jgi:hypothetical protein
VPATARRRLVRASYQGYAWKDCPDGQKVWCQGPETVRVHRITGVRPIQSPFLPWPVFFVSYVTVGDGRDSLHARSSFRSCPVVCRSRMENWSQRH